MRRFHHPRLLSQLKPGDCFTYPKESKEWVVIAMGRSFAIVTDGIETTTELNGRNVILLKEY